MSYLWRHVPHPAKIATVFQNKFHFHDGYFQALKWGLCGVITVEH